ncbi:hypothetical protein HOK22_03920, partial [Candidatus Peregrinibacteria bacterium]|nr:hypothetical protein [Candidatus Peregrinibacteria bacterium]
MKKLFYFLTGLIVIAGITFTFSETGLFKGEFGGHFGGEFGGDSEPTEDYFLRSPASLASLITTNASEAAKYEATAREEMDLSFTSIPLSEEQIGHADTAQIAADSAEIEASEAEETYDRIQPFIDDLSDEVTRINAEIDVIEKEIKDTKEEIEDLEELIEDLEADVILKEEEEAAAELDYRTKKSYFDVCIASDSDLCTVQRVEMDNAWDAWQDIAIPALEAAEGKRNIQVRNIGVQVDKLESLEGELVILQGYPPEVEVAIPTEGELSEAKTAHKDGLAIQTTAEIDRDDARDSADMAASYATDAEAGGDGTSAWIRLNITNQNGAIPRETLDIDNFKLIGGESRTILSVETNDSWHYIDPSGLDTRYHYTIYVIEVYEDSGDGYDKLTLKDLPNGYVNHQIQDRNLKISTDKRKLFPQDIVLIPGYALEITDPLGTILDDATITTKED